MARYFRYDNGRDRFVCDQEKDILYSETFLGDGEYKKSKFGIHQLGKFCPYTEDDGEFDEFPGVIVTDEMLKKSIWVADIFSWDAWKATYSQCENFIRCRLRRKI